MAEFYILDLERTIGMGRAFYWKGNRFGYTDSIKDAGIFTEHFATKIVAKDRNGTTIMVDKNIISKILGESLKKYENSRP